jgi:hypothetical protein
MTLTPGFSGNQSATLFIFDSGGVLVWQSASLPISGAQAPQFSQNPFYATGNNSVTVSSGSASWAWNGKAKDGNIVGTGDYFVKVQVSSPGTTTVYSKVLTVVAQKPTDLAGVTLAPNPASSILVFDLSQAPAGVEVQIQIWNLAGELIREFNTVGGPQSKVIWNLATPGGQPLSDGIYVALLRTTGSDPTLQDQRAIKFVVLRHGN